MKKVLAALFVLFAWSAQAQTQFLGDNGEFQAVPSASITGSVPVASATVNSTRDLTAASGTVVYSGFVFTPSACDGFGAVNNAAFGVYTTLIGHVDSSRTQANIFADASTSQFNGSSFLSAYDSTGSNAQVGTITAFGSGSVSIAWVKTGSPTGTFNLSIRCFK